MVKKGSETKLMKFDPPIKSRYLPGEIDQDIEKVDFENYKGHRLYCANMKAVIDNKAPKFDVEIYYDREKLLADARAAKMNYKENLEITKNINTIFRMGGKVDCWNFREKKHKTDQLEKKEMYKRIMKDNRALYEKVNALSSEYSPRVMAKHWKVLKEQIESKSRFPWFKEICKYPSISANAIRPLGEKSGRRPRCFFDLELAQSNLPLGRIVIELYADYVPLICANFEAFCKGHNGLSYRGTPFHRILSGYWCQGGDVTKFNGIGGASIYEDNTVLDDNYTLQHSRPGVLSTCSDDKKTFDSKFNLTFRPLRTIDDKKVVFGRVVKGIQNLFKLEAYGTKFGKPLEKVIVSKCGILQLKRIRHSSKRQSNQSNRTSDGGEANEANEANEALNHK